MLSKVPINEKALVTKLIHVQLPQAKIIAFGSRVRGDQKKYSDLDIAIDNGQALTLRELSVLSEVFAESELIYKVDIVDLHQIDESFAKLILSSGEHW